MHDWLDDPAQQARFLDYIRLDAEVLPENASRRKWTPSMLEAAVKSPYAMGLSLVLHEYLNRYGELDSLGDVKSRGMVRLISWLVASESGLSLRIWPKMRRLAHLELKGTDPDHPVVGDLCYAPSNGLWLPFQEASQAAVTSLKKRTIQKGITKPGAVQKQLAPDETGPISIAGSDSLLISIGDELMDFLPGLVPAVESLEEFEPPIREATWRKPPNSDPSGLTPQPIYPSTRKPGFK